MSEKKFEIYVIITTTSVASCLLTYFLTKRPYIEYRKVRYYEYIGQVVSHKEILKNLRINRRQNRKLD